MPDDKPLFHVDDDWKKQAQEEKRRLAEQEEQRRQQAPAGPMGVVAGAATAAVAPQQRAARETDQASFSTLVQTLTTQALLYMGEIATRGGEPILNLDMAKLNLDFLGILQDKTHNNLAPEEKSLLDNTLYEVRLRYISIASQYAQLP